MECFFLSVIRHLGSHSKKRYGKGAERARIDQTPQFFVRIVQIEQSRPLAGSKPTTNTMPDRAPLILFTQLLRRGLGFSFHDVQPAN